VRAVARGSGGAATADKLLPAVVAASMIEVRVAWGPMAATTFIDYRSFGEGGGGADDGR
jgi:hypothetical protein